MLDEDHENCTDDDTHNLKSVDLHVLNEVLEVVLATLSSIGSSDPLKLESVREGDDCEPSGDMRFTLDKVDSTIPKKESMPRTARDRAQDYKSYVTELLEAGMGLMCETDSLILDRQRLSCRSKQGRTPSTYGIMIESKNTSPCQAGDFVYYEMPLNDLNDIETPRDSVFTSSPRRHRRRTSTERMLMLKRRLFVDLEGASLGLLATQKVS